MELNLPAYAFRTDNKEGKNLIFDAYRRRWVKLTPEEWVRQHIVSYLTEEKNYPVALMALEHTLHLNRQTFRADAVVYGTNGKPLLIIECKASTVKITQEVFNQIVRYNFRFQVDYLMVTNGISHFCCKINREAASWDYLNEIPDYQTLI